MEQNVASNALHMFETFHGHLQDKTRLVGALLVDQGEQKNTRKSARAENERRHRRHRTDWWNDGPVDNRDATKKSFM